MTDPKRLLSMEQVAVVRRVAAYITHEDQEATDAEIENAEGILALCDTADALREGLRPFYRAFYSRPGDTDWPDETRLRVLLQGNELTWGDLRRAAELVGKGE